MSSDPNVKKVFFCHGVPGGPQDARLLGQSNPDVQIIAIDLFKYPPESIGLAFSEAIKVNTGDSDEDAITLVGFSIGAMAAVNIAATHQSQVSRLVLVSPAAPLWIGDFLSEMAGKPVFELAMKRPKMLRVLTLVQRLMTRLMPSLLINALFRKCGAAEAALLKDPLFRKDITDVLSCSFADRSDNYLAYIEAYVADWGNMLDLVQCPVELWHGTKDTWSPPQMSEALQERFGDKATLRYVQDAEHYSTMAKVVL